MVTNRDVAVVFMHHGVIKVPKGTPVTHQAHDGSIDPERFWVDNFSSTRRTVGPTRWAIMCVDIGMHGIEIPKHCVAFTELTIIKTHWDNPVKTPVTIEFTGKMQRRFLANMMHIMGIGMRKFLKLFF